MFKDKNLLAVSAEPVSSWNRFEWRLQAVEVIHARTEFAAQQLV